MSAFPLVVIGLLLAGQVNAANDRYQQPTAGGGAAPSPAFVPLLESTSQTNGGTDSSRQGGREGDPYLRQGQPAAGNQRPYPSGNSSAPLRGGAAPPPALNGFQTPANSPPGQSVAGQASGPKPTTTLRDLLTPPPGSQLSGEPVPLIEVVSGARSRVEQTQRVEGYWDLCSSVADYYLSLREQEELRRLRSLAPATGSAWQQAEAELRTRMDTSLRAARASQWRVAGWVGRGTGRPPLPADMPHCGSYHSRYAEIFSGRPSTEAQELAELLPLRYAELKDAAAAVTRAKEFLDSVARNVTAEGTGTLRALELFSLRRRAFVQIARDYNHRIARYTELASPGEIGAERLIGMLIKSDSASTATRPTVPGTAGRQSNDATSLPPRTFAGDEGWEPAGGPAEAFQRDDAIQPTSGISPEAPQPPRHERSLLVSPR
jgi:hypothetical protein